MSAVGDGEILWEPGEARARRSRMAGFMEQARASGFDPPAPQTPDYQALWEWSVREPERFWPAVWRFCGVIAAKRGVSAPWDRVLLGGDRMAPPDPELGPRWFAGARLNFAENLLRHRDERPALISWNELGHRVTISHADLAERVAAVAAALCADGVRAGDRVAGYLPNIPETVIAMLAAASIGAIWSSCSPDFGVQGVLDRFGQIEPVVLICADGYRYAGKEIDIRDRVRDIVAALPKLRRVVLVPYLHDGATLNGAVGWEYYGRSNAGSALHFEHLPFDHPLYVMYSSGTTGLPKCMVHGAGGTLLQHLKEHVLHTDLGPDDRFFYFTTCGWMMWNWLVSALAVGAAVVLYDGAPLAPSPSILWDMAEAERITVFGTSARYLALSEKEGLAPARTHQLPHLSTILSTGSSLASHSFDYVYRDIKEDVRLSSISGGTDLISCFALGSPVTPVRRGELQVRGLGMAVAVFDDAGQPVVGQPGELVCTKPFPSMPVHFWDDAGGTRYREAYFAHFPNVWRHGDWAELNGHGGLIIHGRSDATLNPGGVRIGTAEIYRQVEQMDEVVESLVIGQQVERDGEQDVRIVLFVKLRGPRPLDDALRARIRQRIREHASPHHVPKVIVQVADIPRTISGKITELAVRDVIHGRPVKNVEALANPQALELYRSLPELAT
jgi:acetoacetyl-CoA synthetase